jgi:hypothetical protein
MRVTAGANGLHAGQPAGAAVVLVFMVIVIAVRCLKRL